MRDKYCHYVSSSITGVVMHPVSRDIAAFIVRKLLNKSVMSYSMGKEIHGDWVKDGKVAKIDIFVMPLNDY